MPVYPARNHIPKVAELERLFKKQRIHYSRPGFQDSDEFIESEKKIAHFLESYPDYVEARAIDQRDQDHVGTVVPRAAQFIYQKLVEDGRLGACIDASMTLARILEADGVWNYLVKGTLTVTYAPEAGFDKCCLHAFMDSDNSAKAGHVWICAPPYRVVDVTMSLQENTPLGAEKYLPSLLFEEKTYPAVPTVEDLAQDGYCEFKEAYGAAPDLHQLCQISPRMQACFDRYGVFEVRRPGVTLKYCCCAITACDCPLEKMKNLCLSGKYPLDLINNYKEEFKL